MLLFANVPPDAVGVPLAPEDDVVEVAAVADAADDDIEAVGGAGDEVEDAIQDEYEERRVPYVVRMSRFKLKMQMLALKMKMRMNMVEVNTKRDMIMKMRSSVSLTNLVCIPSSCVWIR